jgi:hypothetical protein
MLTDEELNHDPDYIRLIRAVVENAMTDYCKLQHPKNRNKKYLEEGFLSAIAMFFDDDFEFLAFTSFDDDNKPLKTKDLLSILLKTKKVSMDKARQHIIDNSIDYWFNKNFNDIQVPSKITIAGKVYFIHNYTKEAFVDYQNNKIYLNIKKIGIDRTFLKICLEIILKESSIELEKEKLELLFKYFYLFLKINDAFK